MTETIQTAGGSVTIVGSLPPPEFAEDLRGHVGTQILLAKLLERLSNHSDIGPPKMTAVEFAPWLADYLPSLPEPTPPVLSLSDLIGRFVTETCSKGVGRARLLSELRSELDYFWAQYVLGDKETPSAKTLLAYLEKEHGCTGRQSDKGTVVEGIDLCEPVQEGDK